MSIEIQTITIIQLASPITNLVSLVFAVPSKPNAQIFAFAAPLTCKIYYNSERLFVKINARRKSRKRHNKSKQIKLRP